jgi:hypothetical protein
MGLSPRRIKSGASAVGEAHHFTDVLSDDGRPFAFF